MLFCKSVDDVSRAQMLWVDREQYRFMINHRKKVCPVFAEVTVDEAAIDQLPDNAVPDALIEIAQEMPEASQIHTTMHGPANRIAMTYRENHDDEGDTTDDGDDAHLAALPDCGCAHQETEGNSLPLDALNENETIIGVNEEGCPKPLMLLDAWQKGFQTLNDEAAKFAQAAIEAEGEGGEKCEAKQAASALKQAACAETVRTTVAVDMIDVAQKLSKSTKKIAELQSLIALQPEDEEKAPLNALAVPTGKPLSMF